MTTLTHTAPTPARATFVPTGSGLSFTGIIRSEWIKLWSLRSTVWSFSLVVVISLGMTALMASVMSNPATGVAPPAGAPPVADEAQLVVLASTIGLSFGQVVVAVLGVLVISGEYSTGMIKSTLTAMPRRLPALWAKTLVLFVCTFVVGAVSAIGSFLLASAIMAGQDLHASLFDASVIFPLLGNVLFLALIAVFALGVGAILRSSAGGIATVLGILLLLPPVLLIFASMSVQWVIDMMPFILPNAGAEMINPVTLESWQSLLIVLGWVAASLAGAAVLLKRRDA